MDFEVVEVGEGRDWSSPDGSRRLTFYPVSLRGDDGLVQRCEWARKQGNQAPRAGEVVAGRVEDDRRGGLRFKLDFDRTRLLQDQARAAQFQPIGAGPTEPASPVAATPIPAVAIQQGATTPAGQTAKDRSIARMAAQKVAATYYLTLAQAGRLPQQFGPGDVAQAASFFEEDAKR